MLVVEARGRPNPLVRNWEDYLTSAVFGHVRYIPPDIFWPNLFTKAVSVDRSERSLSASLRASGINISEYSEVSIDFWPHTECDVPDMIIAFRGESLRPIRLVVEVKLNAGKSGKGEQDQLAKYFQLVRPDDDTEFSALVYLTRTMEQATVDIRDTIALHSDVGHFANRLYGLSWPDVHGAADAARRSTTGSSRLILDDVSTMLQKLDLATQKVRIGRKTIEQPPGLRVQGDMMEFSVSVLPKIDELYAHLTSTYDADASQGKTT